MQEVAMWHLVLCFMSAVAAVEQEAAHCTEDGSCSESFTSLLQTSLSHGSLSSRRHQSSRGDPIAGQPLNITMDLYDYREHARAFAAKHPNGIPDDTVPRISFAEAQRRWEGLLAEGWNDDDGKKEIMIRMFNNSPGVIQGTSDALNWPARDRWRAEQLKDRLDGLHLRESQYGYPGTYHALEDSAAEVTLKSYIERSMHGGNQILLLNAYNYPMIPSEKEAVHLLGNDSMPRPGFSYKPEDDMDLYFFETLGVGHGWHHHGPVWHGSVIGRKLWFLYPPKEEDEEEFWDKYMPPIETERVPNVCAYLSARKAPAGIIKVYVHPGDVLLVPGGWWHSTCSLDDWTAGTGTWMLTEADVAYMERQDAKQEALDAKQEALSNVA